MSKPVPERIRDLVSAQISEHAELVAEAVAAGHISIELGPWLCAYLVRRDAVWLLTEAMQREADALADVGLEPDWTNDGIDVDVGETLCRRCPAIVQVREAATGGLIVTDRDGSLHTHAEPPKPINIPFGAEAREARRRPKKPLGVDPLTL